MNPIPMTSWNQSPPSKSVRIEGRYFSADAVLNSTTRSCSRMIPLSASSGSAARVAAPSGDHANRRSAHSLRITARMASSETAIAQPPVCRTIRKYIHMPDVLSDVQTGRDRQPAGSMA